MKKIGIIGFVLMMIGGGAMDSANVAIPLIMAFFWNSTNVYQCRKGKQ